MKAAAAKPPWPRNYLMIAVLAGLLLMGSVSYVSVYRSLSTCNNSKWGQGRSDRTEMTVEWLVDEWKRIFAHERKVSGLYRPLVDSTDKQHIDPTRPILSVSLTEKAIDSFSPWGKSTDINIWDLFPPQVACPDVIRLGRSGDGGKWICGTSWFRQFRDRRQDMPRKCLIYSFGVSTDISFEMELQKLAGCEIHAFDPTVGKLPDVREWPPSRASERPDGITLHKLALANASGSSSVFSFEMTLQDIMHSLNHSYIDVLKVDVEGAEWNVFKHLFRNFNKHYKSHQNAGVEGPNVPMNMSTRNDKYIRERSLIPPNHMYADLIEKGQLAPWALPFGQLLIELHYSTVKAADEFFTNMYRAGFLAFSREINLIPTAHGNPPAACEYSFINPNVFFHEEVEKRPQHLQVPPSPLNAEFHRPIKAVIYFLSQKKRLQMLRNALQLLYDNYWLDYGRNYPVVIFQDDIGNAEQTYLQSSVPLMKLKFIEIHFKLPANLDPKTVPNRTVCDPAHSTLGYRHMCRFHATGVHELLHQNGFKDVEYIMRLDDNSHFTVPVGYDLFQYMKVNQKLYGFARTIRDNEDCVTGLWDLAGDFLNRSVSSLHINRTEVFFDKWPLNLVIFNNFEISHVSIWQNPVWKAFMKTIDESGGIYYLRWGDAPIHTIAISMILKVDQVHSFSDMGYYHFMLNQTSRGLPPPNTDPFATVVCVYYDRWICSAANGTNSTNATFALAAPSWGDTTTGKQQHFFTRIGAVSPGSSLQLLDVVKGNQRGVLYTFAMRSREEHLANTLISLYNSFTKQFAYPIVVFYSAFSEPRFDRGRVIELVGRDIASSLRFAGVNTVQFYPQNQWKNISSYRCVEPDKEMYGIIKFLQFDAVQRLSYMGYEWFFRFDESSQFTKPIKFDIFQALALEGKKVAFMNTLMDKSPCWEGAVETVNTLCYGHPEGKQMQQGMEPKKAQYQCANTLDNWPKYAVMLSGFHISHISVWKTAICQRIRSIVESTSSGKDGPKGAQIWPPSFAQTYCIVAGVSSQELKKLDYAGYSFNWYSGKPKNESFQTSAVTNDIYRYEAVGLTDVDKQFLPRRFGWLAGDCGYSFALPSVSELSAENLDSHDNTSSVTGAKSGASSRKSGKLLATKFRKYVWLFGDSLIGTSSRSRYSFV
jgi:hypothetical protein